VTTDGAGGPNRVYEVRIRVGSAEYRQLQLEAAGRGASLGGCAGECLREYFALRAEMASAVTAPGRPGERHTGLIHSILARSEERLVATLDARATELGDGQRRLEGMLDRLVQLYLVHTPEVEPEHRAGAVASATRRYGNYRRAVGELPAGEAVTGAGPGNGLGGDGR
jgi:hypothetical protein